MDTWTIGKVETVIAGFRPRTVEEQVASFARKAVRAACPPSGARARALLFAASRLGAFAAGVGLPLELETCLSVSVIERFILLGCDDVRPATRRSVRTNLRFLARALASDPRRRRRAFPANGPRPPTRQPRSPPTSRSQTPSRRSTGACGPRR